MKANVVIKSAKELPKLGLTTPPSPYIIVQIGNRQDATGIYASSCNPSWNYQTELQAQSMLTKVTFYVYNNNPNDVDELLGFGSTQFETFMSPSLTNSRILLKDSRGNHLKSWIQIQHQNANPPLSNFNIYNNQTAIKISFLGITANQDKSVDWINSFVNKTVFLEYGNEFEEINQNINITTFQFQPINMQIQVRLQLNQKITLNGELHLANVIENSCLRIKMYYRNYEVIAMLGVSFIPNGYLPKQYNTLTFQVGNILLQPIKKVPKNWILVVYGVYDKEIIKNTNEKVKLYVQNDTKLLLQFFEEANEKSAMELQPFASYTIRVNSINWTNNFSCEENIKMYNPVRGISVNINLKCALTKTLPNENIIPKFEKPDFGYRQGKSAMKIDQIKMTGACFNELFTQNTIFYFIYLSNWGTKTIFPSFTLKNSSQYIINCKQTIQQQRGGSLCLITYDHFFGKENENENQFENYLIFKMVFNNIKQLNDCKILYNEKFLGFAKKKSLVSPCKKYDQMIRDRTLAVKLNYRQFPSFEPGLFTINNCSIQGARNSRVQLSFIFDSNQLHLSGEGNTYLMEKPYQLCLQDNSLQFKITQNGKMKQIHCQFQQVFGAPQKGINYKTTIPLPQNRTLNIIYKYQTIKSAELAKKSLQTDQIYRFTPSTQIHMRIHSGFVKYQNCKSFVLRTTKGSTTYQTLQQNPSTQYIRFRHNQQIHFTNQTHDYIFFNLYCTNSENALIIYAGHYNMKNLIGKGFYELSLLQIGDEEKKNSASIIFQVLQNIPPLHSAVNMLIKSIKFSQAEYLRTIMKYYLVSQISNIPINIFELGKTNQSLITNQNIMIKNGQDIVWRLYFSSKPISKEGFWSAEKELIASGKLQWAHLQTNSIFYLRFFPPKEIVSKLNSNALALLEKIVKIIIQYSTEPFNFENAIIGNIQPKGLDIQVLSSVAAAVNILQIIPYNSHEKTIDMEILPFNFQFCSQSRFSLNKQFIAELNNKTLPMVVVQSKKNKEKYMKISQQKVVNFKGKRLKTMDRYGFSVDVEGICLIKAQALLLSNKFINNYKGNLKLLSFSCDNKKVKQVQIYPLDSPHQLKQGIQKINPIKLNLTASNKIDICQSVPTHSITFCLYFVAIFQNKQRIKSMIDLARLQIDKLENKPFKHEWAIYYNGPTVFYIDAEYYANKIQQIAIDKVEYNVQIQGIPQKFVRECISSDKVQLLQQLQNKENIRPDRKRGYRILLTIPENLSILSASVELHDENILNLRKAEHNAKTYVYKSPTQMKVKNIQLQSEEIKMIQQLQEKNFTRRFLINRNPSQVVQLISEPYAISDCKNQSFVINFTLHQIFTKNMDKILWLQSNKKDQILTRQFALLIKHGLQKKIIRSINERGEFQLDQSNNTRTVLFGFEPSIDQLQIYLCIHHALNEKQEPDNLWNDNFENWMKLFPVAYGKINLEKIGNASEVGCELKKILNFNETLDKQLNKIIVQSNLMCLGTISMEKRNWGFITLSLFEVSAIELESQAANSLIFFNFEVENSRRIKIVGTTTQAREFKQVEKLGFLNNKVKFFYMEQKGQTESLKVTASILTFNNCYKIFEKRVDLAEYLRKPGRHQLTTQIKPAQTEGIKNLIQIKFEMTNLNEPVPEIDVVQQARKINKIDLVSFEGQKEDALIMRLFRCQQASHLCETLNQVKQSVIYSKETQISLFKVCGFYLQFQNDPKIINIALEMMNIQLLKNSQIVNKIDQEDITKFYQYIKILFEATELPLPRIEKRLSTSDYDQFITRIDQNNLDVNIKYQKRKLYNAQEMIKAASLTHIQQLIPLIQQFIQKSKIFRALFKSDIQNWTQLMTYKDNSVFVKYINFLDKIYMDEAIPIEIYEDILERGFNKNIPSHSLIQIWSRLPHQKMNNTANKLFIKVVENFGITKQGLESIQSFRTLINFIMMNKLEITPDNWKSSIQKCLEILKLSNDFYAINSYGQLFIKLNSLGLVEQKYKLELIEILKKKSTDQNDKNLKLALSNLIEKLIGKKQVIVSQSSANKGQFYKKYLITS